MNIVWFKKYLRVVDHKPLVKASASELIALYIIEPDLWALEDMSKRQYEFMTESLLDLKKSLRSIGIELTIRVGVAENIVKKHGSRKRTAKKPKIDPQGELPLE